jgi:hypothetical protein
VRLEVPDKADIGISFTPDKPSNEFEQGANELRFSRFGRQDRELEVFSRGRKPVDFTLTVDQPWIRLSSTFATLSLARPQVSVTVKVDSKLASGATSLGHIKVASEGGNYSITVKVVDEPGLLSDSAGYLEGDNVVAIEAEHASRRIAAQGVKWETIPGYGRTLSAVEPFPVQFKPFEPGQGPRLEYDFTTFYNTGTPSDQPTTLDIVVAPSLAFQPGHGLRIAVGFNNEKPEVVDVAPTYLSRDWERSVSDSVRHVQIRHWLAVGKNTLKVYAVDPGVVIERFVMCRGTLPPSYLGPPESVRLSKNP